MHTCRCCATRPTIASLFQRNRLRSATCGRAFKIVTSLASRGLRLLLVTGTTEKEGHVDGLAGIKECGCGRQAQSAMAAIEGKGEKWGGHIMTGSDIKVSWTVLSNLEVRAVEAPRNLSEKGPHHLPKLLRLQQQKQSGGEGWRHAKQWISDTSPRLQSPHARLPCGHVY